MKNRLNHVIGRMDQRDLGWRDEEANKRSDIGIVTRSLRLDKYKEGSILENYRRVTKVLF